MTQVFCSTCNRSFKSQKYYNSHLEAPRNARCLAALQGVGGFRWRNPLGNARKKCRYAPLLALPPGFQQISSLSTDNSELAYLLARALQQNKENQAASDPRILDHVAQDFEESEGFPMNDDNNTEDEDDELSTDDSQVTTEKTWDPDTEILDDFNEYLEHANKNYMQLPVDLRAAINLLNMLQKRRAPLCMYEEIFKWHIEYLRAKEMVTRDSLLERLAQRYNMKASEPHKTKIELPHSKAKVTVITHDFKAQVQSLLSDPRWKDSDYLFHNNDPTAPPPEQFTVLEDINTGKSYRDTWKKMISDPNTQILLPIIFYMDGAITGQYDSLPIESLKFTLGIFNADARDKEYAWRSLGYVANYKKGATEADTFLRESEHVDVGNYVFDTESEDETSESDGSCSEPDDGTSVSGKRSSKSREKSKKNRWCKMKTQGADVEDADLAAEEDNANNIHNHFNQDFDPKLAKVAAQDLHSMMAHMVFSYKKIEDAGGFFWELNFRGERKQYQFIPYVMFIKGDSVEHDKHCGHYCSRTDKVQQICRYCHTKTEKLDQAYIKIVRRKQTKIEKLIERKDLVKLQEISQHCISNVWYELDFGANPWGVHGACPLDMLHWFNLAEGKYTKHMVFEQTGQKSKLSAEFDMLCTSIGDLMHRKSDRNLPRLKFTQGVRAGKLMACEYTGVLLVMAATMRSSQG